MARQQLANSAITTLNGAINDVVTSLIVDDASAFPSSGLFYIGIELEVLLVTAVSGNTLTVVRGQSDSAAASHASGVTVTYIITVEGFRDLFFKDITEQKGLMVNNFTSADFVWDNQNGSTVTDQADGTITLVTTSLLTNEASILYKNAPAGTAWTLDVAFTINDHYNGNVALDYSGAFIGVRDSITGEIFGGQWTNANGVRNWGISQADGPSTNWGFAASPMSFNHHMQPIFFRMERDGNNMIFYHSYNGKDNWTLFNTFTWVGRLTNAPDQVCFGYRREQTVVGNVCVLHIHSWDEN